MQDSHDQVQFGDVDVMQQTITAPCAFSVNLIEGVPFIYH